MLLVRDTPTPGYDVTRCLTTRFGTADRCAADRALAIDERVWGAERAVAARMPRVVTLDVSDDVCAARRCPALAGAVPVYRDANHLSVAFARTLAPRLDDALRRALATR